MEIHWQLLALYSKDTVDVHTMRCWVRKSRGGGGNVACHCNITMWTDKKSNLLTKIEEFLREP